MANFFCDYCEKSFTRKSNLKVHIANKHRNTITKLKCPLWPRCRNSHKNDGTFSSLTNLRVHFRRIHPNHRLNEETIVEVRIQAAKKNSNQTEHMENIDEEDALDSPHSHTDIDENRNSSSSTEDNEEMEEIIREIIASDSDDTHNAEEPEEHLNQMEDIQNINEENTLGSHHSSKNNDENSNSSSDDMEEMIRAIIVDESLEFSEADSKNSSGDDMETFLMEFGNEIEQATDTDIDGQLSPTAPTATSIRRRASI